MKRGGGSMECRVCGEATNPGVHSRRHVDAQVPGGWTTGGNTKQIGTCATCTGRMWPGKWAFTAIYRTGQWRKAENTIVAGRKGRKRHRRGDEKLFAAQVRSVPSMAPFSVLLGCLRTNGRWWVARGML